MWTVQKFQRKDDMCKLEYLITVSFHGYEHPKKHNNQSTRNENFELTRKFLAPQQNDYSYKASMKSKLNKQSRTLTNCPNKEIKKIDFGNLLENIEPSVPQIRTASH
jgi:hypothetical protein